MAANKLSISEASRRTSMSRNTIAKDLASGKLSYERGRNGTKMIDASELARVYGDRFRTDESAAGGAGSRVGVTRPSSLDDVGQQMTYLSKQLESQIQERERERQQSQRQIDHLQDALKLAQEGQNKMTLLLESRIAGGGEWRPLVEALEKRVANQELSATQIAAMKAQAKRDAFREIQDQSVWRLIWRLMKTPAE